MHYCARLGVYLLCDVFRTHMVHPQVAIYPTVVHIKSDDKYGLNVKYKNHKTMYEH